MATESKEQESTEWDPYEKDQELGRRQHVVDLAFLYECDAEVAGRPKEDIKREIMGEIRKYGACTWWSRGVRAGHGSGCAHMHRARCRGSRTVCRHAAVLRDAVRPIRVEARRGLGS